MSLHPLPLDKITLASLEQLIQRKTRESRLIDYKRAWDLSGDKGKQEFLADVSSFANTDGGELVYGMDETDGIATAIRGLVGFARDKEQLRAEHVLARGLEPRLGGVEFTQVDLSDGRLVFIVRIARSGNPPHMVCDTGRFYKRISAGRMPMNAEEVRAASLVHVQGHAFWRDPSALIFRNRQRNIETPNLLLPAAIVEVLPIEADTVLKPAFDEVWHACGSFGSPHFDQAGRWKRGTREL